jgi:hypothetical protein
MIGSTQMPEWNLRIHGHHGNYTVEGLVWSAVSNWLDAIAAREDRQRTAPTASRPEEWRCSLCGGSMVYQLRQFTHVCRPDLAGLGPDTPAEGPGSGRGGVDMGSGLPPSDADVPSGSSGAAPPAGIAEGVPTDVIASGIAALSAAEERRARMARAGAAADRVQIAMDGLRRAAGREEPESFRGGPV